MLVVGRSFGNLRLAIPSANGLGPFGVINAGEPIDDTLFDHRSTNLQNPSHALLSLSKMNLAKPRVA